MQTFLKYFDNSNLFICSNKKTHIKTPSFWTSGNIPNVLIRNSLNVYFHFFSRYKKAN